MAIKLSIITINYNNATGLKKTIESVTEQTFRNFEYLVIDGGSSDDSINIINKNKKNISYFVSEPDSGIYNAMNKGIIKAKGDYIMFLNSGDWLVQKNTINEIFSYTPSEDIVYGNMIKVFNDNKIEVDKGPQRSDLKLSDIYFHTINHSSAIIRKTLFNKYGLYDESYKIVADWLFFLKTIGLEGVTVKYIDVDFNYFDKSGISSTQLDLRNQERLRGINELLPKSIILDYEELNTLRNRVVVLDNIKKRKSLYLAFKLLKKMFL